MPQSIREGLTAFIQEKMAQYDSDVDTSTGSRFYTQVIQPLLNRYGPDPTDVDARQVIEDRLLFFDPDIRTDEGTGIRDLIINTMATIAEPYKMVAREVLRRSSWDNIETMTEEEADRLASNIFITRNPGARATGRLRLLFGSPREVFVTPANVAYAGDLRFVPSRTQTISAFAIANQVAGSYYYFDIDMVAEEEGSEYEVDAGSITRMDGVSGLLAVQQLQSFEGGLDRQSNTELRDWAREAISVRNVVTERAIRTVLIQEFPTIGRLVVQGRNDPLMLRDVVRGTLQITGLPLGIRGPSAPSLAVADSIHIGGMTDVWIAPAATAQDTQQTLDILNLYDEGRLVYWSNTGQVSSDNAQFLSDDRGFFTEDDGGFLPAQTGDILIVQGVFDDVDSSKHKEFTIDQVNAKSVRVSDLSGISGIDLVNVSYEIRRRSDSVIELSPDTLVAEEAGVGLLTNEGDPLLPIPGRRLSSEGVASSLNISSGNISLPIFEIETIELLDPINPTETTGEFIPEADPVGFYLYDRVSPTKFWVRVLYRIPTRFAVIDNPSGLFNAVTQTRFYTADETRIFTPKSILSPEGEATPIDDGSGGGTTALIQFSNVTTSTPFEELVPSRVIRAGDRITYRDTSTGLVYQSVVASVVVGVSSIFQVEDAIFPLGGSGRAVVSQGILATNMTSSEASGLFYVDILADLTTGSDEVIGESLATPTSSWYSQGWRLFSRLGPYAHSVHEEPILQLTDYVNDDTDLTLAGTNIRVTYKTTELVQTLQEFFDQDEERAPAEDVLVKRMPLARVHMAIEYDPDTVIGTPDSNTAYEALRDAINLSSGISATSLSNVLENLGSPEVTYPFATISEFEGLSRTEPEGYGRILTLRSFNGTLLPEGVASAISLVYQIADYRVGSLQAISS